MPRKWLIIRRDKADICTHKIIETQGQHLHICWCCCHNQRRCRTSSACNWEPHSISNFPLPTIFTVGHEPGQDINNKEIENNNNNDNKDIEDNDDNNNDNKDDDNSHLFLQLDTSLAQRPGASGRWPRYVPAMGQDSWLRGFWRAWNTTTTSKTAIKVAKK